MIVFPALETQGATQHWFSSLGGHDKLFLTKRRSSGQLTFRKLVDLWMRWIIPCQQNPAWKLYRRNKSGSKRAELVPWSCTLLTLGKTLEPWKVRADQSLPHLERRCAFRLVLRNFPWWARQSRWFVVSVGLLGWITCLRDLTKTASCGVAWFRISTNLETQLLRAKNPYSAVRRGWGSR